jgi:putative transposase
MLWASTRPTPHGLGSGYFFNSPMVHFYRNVFSHVPAGKLREVALMLKAIHAQEDLQAAQRKATEVIARLRNMRLRKAAELVETAGPETLAYYAFPEEH